MKAHNKLTIAASLVLVLGAVGIAMAIDYGVYTPIEDVDITYPVYAQIVFAGCDYTVTCTTSTDEDCHQEGDEIIIDDDPVTHTWSGPGTFSPGTGTSVTWTTPTATGRTTIHVVADDSPLANDTAQSDSVSVTVSNIIYVDEDATAGNDDGTTWANAFLDLKDALDAADSNCLQIWVAEGTYKPGTSPSDSFDLVDGVELYGGFDPTVGDDEWSERDWVNNVTTLSGDIGTVGVDTDNSYHVVFSENCGSDTVLDGFTITKGNANGSGQTAAAGGMYSYDASTTIANCTFTGNNATFSCGAMFVQVAADSVQEITNCVFTDNTCDGDAGALLACGAYRDNDQLKMTNCVIANNSAGGVGGGMYAFLPAGHIYTNCVFTGNHSDTNGGAIYMDRGGADFLNLTVVANDADEYGGGIYTTASTASYPEFANCIFWDNTASDAGEIYNHTDESDPTFNYCDIEGGINGSKCGGYDSIDGGGNINANPNFVDDTDPDGDDDQWMTADDGLAIDDTRAIDAANGNVDPTTDILGNSRYDDSGWLNIGIGDPTYADMGAYEYQGS